MGKKKKGGKGAAAGGGGDGDGKPSSSTQPAPIVGPQANAPAVKASDPPHRQQQQLEAQPQGPSKQKGSQQQSGGASQKRGHKQQQKSSSEQQQQVVSPQPQSDPPQKQGQRGPPQQQQVQEGPPQLQLQGGPPQQQRGPPQQQRGHPPQQQGGPHQQQQQGGPPPQQQWGPLQQQQQQRGPPQQQQQRGPPQQQQQQWGPPQQQQQQWGPPQQQQQQRGPPQQQQQQRGSPQQQQQQRGSPQQQQQQWGPPQQQQQQQQQQWGSPQQQQQQQWGSPQQQQQRGPPQQQQRGPPQQQQQGGFQQQQRGAHPQQQRGPPHLQQGGPPQQQRGPPQQQAPARPQQFGAGQQVPRQPEPASSQQRGTPPGEPNIPPQQLQGQPPLKQSQQTPTERPSSQASDCLMVLDKVIPGTLGRPIKIESNHLELKLGNLKSAIHYDVDIVPDTPKSLLREAMILFGQKHYPSRHPAFDGRKNLYTAVLLPFGEHISDTVTVQGENRPREFRITVKFARNVDLTPLHDMMRTKNSPQDAIQCLDIVLRNAPSNTCITAGRCFFTPPHDQIIPLGEGMEMYYGFYQSAIRGWKPLLNVDVAHKAFPQEMNVLDLICDLGSDYRNKMTRNQLTRPINDYLKTSVEKFLRTLKVCYEIPGQSGSKRNYRVNGLGEPANRARFTLEDGRTSTVAAYFSDVKRTRLQYPDLPTLWVGSRERQNKILLPIEFCTVVGGQTVNRKMTENQTSNMIKQAATSTSVRKNKIMKSLQTANYNADPCIREFGIEVGKQFQSLDARVLPPPALQYANGTARVNRGVWRSDRLKFITGATITKWTIACVTRQPNRDMEKLAQEIFKYAPDCGMNMTQKATPPFTPIGGRQSLQDIIRYFETKADFDLIFVVVPRSGPQYAYVKQAAELNVGCLTQCIKEYTLGRLNQQVVINILLKVNSKLNGVNHSLQIRPPIMDRPCMVMGADVTHPSPDARDIPSVAAVTASHDAKAFKYNICWRLQPPKVEIIEDLYNITIEQLKYFHKMTNHKPERIVFFRDGVSEGQFQQVKNAEINAIRRACKSLQADGYEPAITFLIVQKRHHTRLFPTNPQDSEDRDCNVPAGTCVDTQITNPRMQDFYLVSHASIKGVAKPTKYCTLWDDNNMSNDAIEALTYHLCHMFTRCNRSVSYPAPTYYAHLAAARAKVYIENQTLRTDKDALEKFQRNNQIKECISKGKPMFFV